MPQRENEMRARTLRFSGNEILLAVQLVEKLQHTIDVVYYLMDHEDVKSFVIMLISAKNIDLNALLEKEKRDTDILFEIDKDEPLYAMICQDTKVDGGYRFAERVIRNSILEGATDIFCSELEVRTTQYALKHVIFRVLKTYINSKHENKSGEIIFKSLN